MFILKNRCLAETTTIVYYLPLVNLKVPEKYNSFSFYDKIMVTSAVRMVRIAVIIMK